MKKIAIVLTSLAFAACASPKTTPTQSAQTGSPAPVAAATTPADTQAVSTPSVDTATLAANRTAAELQKLQNESVYFDYDKFAVKSEFRDILRQQVEYIKSHKDDVVTIEGNADERGSDEYNFALGEKRASSVRKSLELMGIPASQIKIVSLGDSKPKLECHEEKCWHENRRVDFVHKQS